MGYCFLIVFPFSAVISRGSHRNLAERAARQGQLRLQRVVRIPGDLRDRLLHILIRVFHAPLHFRIIDPVGRQGGSKLDGRNIVVRVHKL